MSNALLDYFLALERLQNGHPVNVPKNSKITNDNVSLEAGRKKGTIKKSRPIFKLLIDAIDAASATHNLPLDLNKATLNAAKADAARYRTLWEEALSREVSLINELWRVQKQLTQEKAKLSSRNVASINARKISDK